MKRLRRILPVVPLLALLALALPSNTMAATTYQFHVTGYTAEAYFGSWNGSVLTEAYVASGQNVSGSGNVTPYTLVQADVVDFSSGMPVFITNYFGSVNTSTLQIDNKLTAASLSGNIPVYDMNGKPATLSVNVTWTGIGSVVRQVSNNHIGGKGFTVNDHFNGTSRPAGATGTVSDGTTNYATGTSQFADLNHVNEGSTSITR